MNKHFKSLHELHHEHKITHKVLGLIIFSVIILLTVYGLQKVNASLAAYAKVPNGPANVCFKADTDYNDLSNHVSCSTHEKVCITDFNVLVGCDTKRPIDYK